LPSSAEHRLPLHRRRSSLKSCRRRPPGPSPRRTASPVSHPPPILFLPLDPDSTSEIRRDSPKRYRPMMLRHVGQAGQPPRSIQSNSFSKFESKFQIATASCKIDRKKNT
jgi:hypothetical protein